jgi:hypothetical protein
MENSEEKNQTTVPPSDILPPVTISAKSKKQSHYHKIKKHIKILNSKNLFEFIMVIANISLVIVTLSLVCANWQLVKDSNKQVESTKQMVKATEEMSLAARQSVAVAESSIAVAKKSLETTKQGIFAANVPYITVNITKYDVVPEVGKVLRAVAQYKNVGKTPAINFRQILILNIEKKDRYNPLKPIPKKISTSKILLAPGDDISQDIYASHALTEKDVSLINAGILQIVVRCVVNYNDIFNQQYMVTHREVYDTQYKCLMYDEKENEYKQY